MSVNEALCICSFMMLRNFLVSTVATVFMRYMLHDHRSYEVLPYSNLTFWHWLNPLDPRVLAQDI